MLNGLRLYASSPNDHFDGLKRNANMLHLIRYQLKRTLLLYRREF